MRSNLLGTLLIAVAATLWATDSLFRLPAVQVVSPTFIVLFEHVIGFFLMGIWVWFKHPKKLSGYPLKSWLAFFMIGAGSSALATVLFTASFQYINPSVAILIQKTQPIFVILLALVFLGEKPKGRFWLWAVLAIVAVLIVSFPGFDFHFLNSAVDVHSRGVIYALLAAGLWGAGTVAGKSVTQGLPPSVVTFWRYVFGLITLIALMQVSGERFPAAELHQLSTLRTLLYIAFVPGIAGLLFYYQGLKRSTAISATFTELLYPVSAVVLNWIFLGATLSSIQLLGGAVLLFAVSRIAVSFS